VGTETQVSSKVKEGKRKTVRKGLEIVRKEGEEKKVCGVYLARPTWGSRKLFKSVGEKDKRGKGKMRWCGGGKIWGGLVLSS